MRRLKEYPTMVTQASTGGDLRWPVVVVAVAARCRRQLRELPSLVVAGVVPGSLAAADRRWPFVLAEGCVSSGRLACF